MSDEPPNPDDLSGEGAETDETAGAGPAGDEQRGERPLTDEERAALLKEQLKRLRVIDVVYDMMVQLVQLGYQKLGLTEETRELRDLDDARVAVEALRRLIEVAEAEADSDVASLRATLAQMQLSFARAAQETGAPSEGGAGPRLEGDEPDAESTDGEPES